MTTGGCPTGCSCNWKKLERKDPERLTEMFRLLEMSNDYVDQTEGRGAITGLQHALRCAALAEKYVPHPDGAFIGLVHDLARPLNDVHHGEIIAEIVRDRVSDLAYTVLRTHGQYQSKIVHKTEWPEEPDAEAGTVGRLLAGLEVRSFAKEYTGPIMNMDAARGLLRRYLDW